VFDGDNHMAILDFRDGVLFDGQEDFDHPNCHFPLNGADACFDANGQPYPETQDARRAARRAADGS
jgi:hypothetical protein